MISFPWEKTLNNIDLITLFHKVRKRIATQGLLPFLYDLANLINFPPNGFPRYGVDKFMQEIAGEVTAGVLVLDAGAGHRPYRNLFRHTVYESCDYLPVLEEVGGDTGVDHTFFCDLENIPRPENTYDVIICNQVLEHLKIPAKAIAEFHRVLKPGGVLYLTAPQCFGIHMAPHNYFNFLDSGLKFLLTKAGFQGVTIRSLGGTFWLLGKVTEKAYGCLIEKIRPGLRGLYLPFHLLVRLNLFFFFFILFFLDGLDREKGWTLNYGCSGYKPRGADGPN